MTSPGGESPQTERTIQQSLGCENGLAKGGPHGQKELLKQVRILKMNSPRGRPHRQKDLLKNIRLHPGQHPGHIAEISDRANILVTSWAD